MDSLLPATKQLEGRDRKKKSRVGNIVSAVFTPVLAELTLKNSAIALR
jgi:hypothetical protein